MSVSERPPTIERETVAVPRLTVAAAIDLLSDRKREYESRGSAGPYLDELSATVAELEASLAEE